jgi:hypothetical protein
MKRAHRRAHRTVWAVLAIVVPATIAAGLHARLAPKAEVRSAAQVPAVPGTR